jgi:hypothetical protein
MIDSDSGGLRRPVNQQTFDLIPALRENIINRFDPILNDKINVAQAPKRFDLSARPGEYYVYQVGVLALRADLADIRVEFSDLKPTHTQIIPPEKMTCFNKGGVDFKGRPFEKKIPVPAGRCQVLWMGIDLEGINEDTFSGSVSIVVGEERRTIPLQLQVTGEPVPNHGYNEGRRLSRLNWLNSTLGMDENITKGYKPIRRDDATINILGRTLEIAPDGLPAAILSFFGPSNQTLVATGEPIANKPFRFTIEKGNGEILRLQPGKLTFLQQTPSTVTWTVLNTSDECDLECAGQMEFDGVVDYRLKLTAKTAFQVKDIRLEIPIHRDKAEYMMGLGHEGGFRTPDWKWTWDVAKHQDSLWVGSVNGGVRIKWKAENYVRPLVNLYYPFGPLNLPPSWGNQGKGGVDVVDRNDEVLINAYSGNRILTPGEILNYDFELLLTPFRLMDKKIQFGDRYFHESMGVTKAADKRDRAIAIGANIVNIHHAEDVYPFINYPYLDENTGELARLVADAHRYNLRMKLYYTTRELTNNLPEFPAFFSLNGEVIFPGPGNEAKTLIHPNGPAEWLKTNLQEKYIPAWFNLVNEGIFKGETDLSVITTPDSRLNNFYIAGLDWMVQHLEIDGVYIDDSALDRFTLRRARKIIDRYRPEGRMDLHSWNSFNEYAAFANCLNIYMDLLPYFDLVWIGEGRDYDRMSDHWLIEVSGIPFGLPGQMLEGGGNPWRGMVYGITTRAGWTGNPPSEIWKFWDEYSIQEKVMIGYWEKNTPVTCDNPLVRTTLYRGDRESIIAVANWNDKEEEVRLKVDWESIGHAPGLCEVFIPEVKEFQPEYSSVTLDHLTIPAKKGFLIVIRDSTKG